MTNPGTAVWILGATGRVGRGSARLIASSGDFDGILLVGRSSTRLGDLARSVGAAADTWAVDSIDAIADRIESDRPAVVINLLGSYSQTSARLAQAALKAGSYLDLANDLESMGSVLALDAQARAAHGTVITGAGFGVLATEAAVAHLRAGSETPEHIRVDALASFASPGGPLGEAFAQTSVDVMRTGGRAYRSGRLVRVRLGSNHTHHSLPDGTTVDSAAVPSGELLAAQRVSGAPNVDFTSALAPTTPLMRTLLPALSVLASIPVARRAMVRRLAATETPAAPSPRPHSWGHAVMTWLDGTRREAWLRTDDAMDFTVRAVAAVASALSSNERPFGAFTPAQAFGAEIVTRAGATIQ